MRRALGVLAALLVVGAPAVIALRAQAADYEPASEEEWRERDARTAQLARRIEVQREHAADAWRYATSWPRVATR